MILYVYEAIAVDTVLSFTGVTDTFSSLTLALGLVILLQCLPFSCPVNR